MKNIAVIYSSKYGTTKRYAPWIAQSLNAPVFAHTEVNPAQLSSYDVILYGGGLYAGGIDGVKLATKNPCKTLVVFTVGLANPAVTDYSAILEKNFTAGLFSKVKVFYLRGGIDYKQLGLVHKGMMAAMKNMITNKPESERSDEDKVFLETYGTQVDFTDRETIQPILDYVLSLGVINNLQ